MVETGIHFAQPAWLWGLLLPLPVALWLRHSRPRAANARLERYADPDLMPHLLRRHRPRPGLRGRRFAWWAVLWSLLSLAMAGPRWDYTDIRLFRPGSNLVVLLDISRSMETRDLAPDRMARARQEIADLLDEARGVRIGLVAFASVAHVVAPLTEDSDSIRRLLPALGPKLVHLTGSRLGVALQRAGQLLASQPPESGKAVLLITDGDFAEAGLDQAVARLVARGIHLHVLGVGTAAGAEVPGPDGEPLVGPDGQPVVSRLDEALLRHLAQRGEGLYQRADFRDDDTRAILERVRRERGATVLGQGRTRIWHERFYWLVGLALLLLAPLLRGRETA